MGVGLGVCSHLSHFSFLTEINEREREKTKDVEREREREREGGIDMR